MTDEIETVGIDAPEAEAPVPANLAALVNRLAAIQDELQRRGVTALQDEDKKLRDELKALMIADERDRVFDEESGAFARLSPVTEDAYDTVKLRGVLPAEVAGQVIVEAVDTDAMKEGLRIGAISRARLEAAGAVFKRVKHLSMRVYTQKGSAHESH
jgi:hypothetical protein